MTWTSSTYPSENIIDADYTDDLVLLANRKSLLHSLEHAARGIGLYVNSDKTEFMCFNQDVLIKWQAYEMSKPVHLTW